jgi:hypothetical protein
MRMRGRRGPGERTEPLFVRFVMRVGTVLVYIALFVGFVNVIAAVVNLARGEFKTAFVELVFGLGMCSTLGYTHWYGRNVTRKRNVDRKE